MDIIHAEHTKTIPAGRIGRRRALPDEPTADG